jgi:hypothetical protein
MVVHIVENLKSQIHRIAIFGKADIVNEKLLSWVNVNNLKALKKELEELLEEDAKYDKLRMFELLVLI